MMYTTLPPGGVGCVFCVCVSIPVSVSVSECVCLLALPVKLKMVEKRRRREVGRKSLRIKVEFLLRELQSFRKMGNQSLGKAVQRPSPPTISDRFCLAFDFQARPYKGQVDCVAHHGRPCSATGLRRSTSWNKNVWLALEKLETHEGHGSSRSVQTLVSLGQVQICSKTAQAFL